jgi:hypothetical protein
MHGSGKTIHVLQAGCASGCVMAFKNYSIKKDAQKDHLGSRVCGMRKPQNPGGKIYLLCANSEIHSHCTADLMV